MINRKQTLKRVLTLLKVMAVMILLGYHISSQAQEGKDQNQPPNVQPSAAASPPQSVQPSSAPRQPSPEEIALRAQLQTIREYNDNLLSTVHWALGTVITIVVLLTGFSWFAGFRVSSREKDALKQELLGVLKQEGSSFQQHLQDDINRRFTSFEDEAKKFQAEIKKSATSAGEDAAAKVKKQVDDLKNDVEVQVHYLKEGLGSLEIDVLEIEAKQWDSQGVWANALICRIKILEQTIKVNEHMIPHRLDQMKSLLKKMSNVDAEEAGHLQQLMDSIPKHHSIVVEEIRDLLKRVRDKKG